MRNSYIHRAIIIISLLILNFNPAWSQKNKGKLDKIVISRLKSLENPFGEWKTIGKVVLDSVLVNEKAKNVELYFSSGLSYYPVREENYDLLMHKIKDKLGKRFRKYQINPVTDNKSLIQLIPNIYRHSTPIDLSRIPVQKTEKPVLIKKLNVPEPGKGLFGNSIAIWHSHGYYFEMNLDRWEWQRARLFGTVEDISVMGFVLPYLTKMLENSGANVFLPRERDTQSHEVIVDNDKSTGNSEVVLHLNNNTRKLKDGFLLSDTLFPGYNPFKHGTSLQIRNDSAIYIPEIPEDGNYAVYISYPARADNDTKVIYTVRHSGGKTEFVVNQTIGGETWIYLGSFWFRSGKEINKGSVTVRSDENSDKYIALDAIRFGGGMGNVARRPSSANIKNQLSVSGNQIHKAIKDSSESSKFSWKLSGKPRFLEAARYYLQYAGMPDTLVYSPNNLKNDYNDDYQSRGLWVNYLMNSPAATTDNTEPAGMGIPIDLSFAFHSDAGITPNDSVIGTLAIYSTGAGEGKFPDGTSRLASRDMADMIQTQVVGDIRALFDPHWTRRGLWDKPYSEARKPNAPAVLMELLSHQNLADQQYGLDPRFRFRVSRSIYTGILKYLSYIEKHDYVVQPLPVKNLSIVPMDGKRVHISWIPTIDTLEPTSVPEKYMIYKRTEDNGFGNGIIVNNTSADIELESYNKIYGFKVTALNAGGESFDSEILSVGIKEGNTNKILVVNGFDRISGPGWFDENKLAGISWWNDRGVPDHYDICSVGDQYDFNRNSAWLDDDSPGWGASYGDNEGKIFPGNSFDFPYIHGKAIMAAGYSFSSVSKDYFCLESSDFSSYKSIDLIFGKEKSTTYFTDSSRIDFSIYTTDFMKKIIALTTAGKNIFMSGAYVGTDLSMKGDSSAIKFAGKYLHFLQRTGHAVKTGKVYATDYIKPLITGPFDFNTGYQKDIYSVEAPDAIEPTGKGAVCALRYSETNASAGVIYNGKYKTVILGFPFETILSEQSRNTLMEEILNYFKK